MNRGTVRRVLLAVALVAVSACTPAGDAGPDDDHPPGATGCGPVPLAEIRGRKPRYVDAPVADTPNDHALCRGLWLPRTEGTPFVPQGLVVEGDIAFVSGYDSGRVGSKYCRVVTIDLRTGRKLDEQGIDFADGRLWVLSESTARPYFRQGGRPVVPQLAAYDVSRLAQWQEPPCEP